MLGKTKVPTWIFSGDQIFPDAVTYKRSDGKSVVKESIKTDHPLHFEKILSELKTLEQPVAFASGDMHFSEISELPTQLGYTSYEFTSSPLHANLVQKAPGDTDLVLPNTLRMTGINTSSFISIKSEVVDTGLSLDVAIYADAKAEPFVFKKLSISKTPGAHSSS